MIPYQIDRLMDKPFALNAFLNTLMDEPSYRAFQETFTFPLSKDKCDGILCQHLQSLPICLDTLANLRPFNYQCSPEVQALLVCLQCKPIEDWHLFKQVCQFPRYPFMGETVQCERMIPFIREFLSDLRGRLLSAEVQEAIAQHKAMADHAFRETMAYIEGLFAQKPEYTGLLVDFENYKGADFQEAEIKAECDTLYKALGCHPFFGGIQGYVLMPNNNFGEVPCVRLLLFFDANNSDLNQSRVLPAVCIHWSELIQTLPNLPHLQNYAGYGFASLEVIRSDDESIRTSLAKMIKQFCENRTFTPAHP